MVLFSEELIIATLAILFITIIVLVISHWVYNAQKALEKGRIRVKAMDKFPQESDE